MIRSFTAVTQSKLFAQLLRFGVSTGFSAAMSFGLPIILHEAFGIEEKVAVAIGFAVAYLGNLLLLRMFVFKSTNDWKRDTAAYVVTNGVFRLLEYAAFLLLLDQAGLSYVPALLAVLVVSSIVKFFAYRTIFAQR